MSTLERPDRYDEILAQLKQQVRGAHLRAQRAVNTELIGLYWHIGRTILEQQRTAGWGGKVVQQLAHDLRREFPEMTGLSRSNLMYMRSFAEGWPDGSSIVQQAAGQLPWGHIMLLIDKLDARNERDWYAARAVAEGWSRAALEHNIMGQLRQRIGAAPSSFDGQLEERDARLAQTISRDPYVFDFLGLAQGAAERELEQAMIDRIVDVLRELGPGWASSSKPASSSPSTPGSSASTSPSSTTSSASPSTRAHDRNPALQRQERIRRSVRTRRRIRPAGGLLLHLRNAAGG